MQGRCGEKCGEVCWRCGRGEWRVVGGVEKCVGYMIICDDLMRGRFDATRNVRSGVEVGSLKNGGSRKWGGGWCHDLGPQLP